MIVRRGIQVKTLDDWLPQLPFQGEIAGAYILSSEARLGSEMRQKRSFTVGRKHDIQGAFESPLSGRQAKTVPDPKRT